LQCNNNREQLPDGNKIEGDILSQQDCMQGRDAVINNNNNGYAGFSYQKIGNKGKKLSANAKEWQCVLDKVTGLLWEVKQPGDKTYGNQGLHDGDDLFTWYNPNQRINGGAIGDWNSRYAQCAGYSADQPATYCNIEEFVSRVNQQSLCGFKNWRVPTLMELATLVNFGRTSPSIDVAYFPDTPDGYYWSSSPDADLQETAWAVNFQFGSSAPMPRDNPRYVRLVREWNPGLEKIN
jgi:hypothetical protein